MALCLGLIKMKLQLYVIDAFTSELFKGNPAGVVVLQNWLSEAQMQAIASENNLSETAFMVKDEQNRYVIRWFSPLKEIAFCGHATLASAFVLSRYYQEPWPIVFLAKAVGELTVSQRDEGLMEMDFPNQAPTPVDETPAALIEGLGLQPVAVLKNRQAYFAVYESEEQIRSIRPNLDALKKLAPYDAVVTAPGIHHDFASRYFWPANGGEEDPVTGSIHTGLAPYWAGRLNKTELVALQASRRTGVLHCRVTPERVYISGNCVQYLQGTIDV